MKKDSNMVIVVVILAFVSLIATFGWKSVLWGLVRIVLGLLGIILIVGMVIIVLIVLGELKK